jgi:hypothetical protein
MFNQTTIAISFGYFFIIVAISSFTNPNWFSSYIDRVKSAEQFSSADLVLLLLSSMTIVGVTNFSTFYHSLATVIAYVFFIKMAVFIIFPKVMSNILSRLPEGKGNVSVLGVIYLVVGVILISPLFNTPTS